MPGILHDKEIIRFPSEPRLPQGVSLRYFPTVLSSWRFSAERLTDIASKLREEFDDEWFSVALAGSYGRMDAGPQADADFLLLVNRDRKANGQAELIERLRSLFIESGMLLPNSKGCFSKPVSVNNFAKTIGVVKDDLHDLARRMVLLMEMKCVYNEPLFNDAITKLLNSYLKYQLKEPDKLPIFLLNDAIRYFRSICVNYEANFTREHQKWPVRLVKLRHTRVLMFVGLLLLVLNSSRAPNKFSYIQERIHLTPLERIADVYADCGELDVSRVFGPYNIFLSHMNDPTFRDKLSLADYEDRYEHPEYALLKASSVALSAELSRFILDRRGYWPHQLFGDLLF